MQNHDVSGHNDGNGDDDDNDTSIRNGMMADLFVMEVVCAMAYYYNSSY
ncbi:MAG: hypothetical protein ACI90V_005133 [Bacillariaceae sp.]|jgi:hypothetical protein